MQMEEAQRLQREWAGKGNPPCAHEVASKEYYLGTQTGDRVCHTCGQVV